MPFFGMKQIRVLLAVAKGDRPPRPEVAFKGLSRELWDLAEACWCSCPQSRPTAAQVLNQLQRLLGKYG